MNPFADVEDFEAMRTAALTSEAELERHLRVRAASERRHLQHAARLRLSERTLRMVRLAIASSRAVLLVGPPGTGKTEILSQVLEDIDAEPQRFGLTRTGVETSWVTPEEEWTFDSIVVGETVSAGEIQSVEGKLLEAIREDKWLVLDEANRADMDRVLGGVLTWLSGKRVRVGTWREATVGPPRTHESHPVYLDWSNESASTCDVATADGGREYVAGADWRVLGTYNAVDAQRVFRMGQALSRRFKHVPIPPADLGDFRLLITDFITEDSLRSVLVTRISAIYDAHLAVEDAQLGAGLFVDMPAYVEAGRRMNTYDGQDPADFEELLAEAYLASVGAILARFEPDVLLDLGAEVVDKGGLSGPAWEWILSQLVAMRA